MLSVRVGIAMLAPAAALFAEQWAVVDLTPIGSGTTSPAGLYRWLDIADQAYAASYRETYTYSWATVRVTYETVGPAFRGTLAAANLKPNFAYQIKLLGTPDTPCNESIGLAGRWWRQEWTGSAWSAGWNLNDKGDGSSPNPNDAVYFATRDTPDPTSPTGRHYRYTAYLVLDYFITDELGSAFVNFEANSSYHVLWKPAQRPPTSADGPVEDSTFDPSPSLHPAYDTDYPVQTVGVFGEWERLPVGGVRLARGGYSCRVVLTEESFHGSGGALAGSWAAALSGDVAFTITDSRPAIAEALIEGSPFSPNGDGRHDAALVRFRVQGQLGAASVSVRSADEKLVRTFSLANGGLSMSDAPGGYEARWDGKDESGDVVPDGRYACVIEAQDTQGARAEPVTLSAVVDTRRPILSALGVGRQGRIRWRQSEAGRVRLRIQDSQGRIMKAWLLTLPAGRQSQTWDGRDLRGAAVPPGAYYVSISMRDDALNPSRRLWRTVLVWPRDTEYRSRNSEPSLHPSTPPGLPTLRGCRLRRRHDRDGSQMSRPSSERELAPPTTPSSARR